MNLNRRSFLISTGSAALSCLTSRIAKGEDAVNMGAPVRTIEWTTPDLSLSFIVDPNERLWQRGFLPSSMRAQGDKTCDGCGVEVAIQVSG